MELLLQARWSYSCGIFQRMNIMIRASVLPVMLVMCLLAMPSPAEAVPPAPPPVPEPGSLLLLGVGLAAFGVRSYLRRRP